MVGAVPGTCRGSERKGRARDFSKGSCGVWGPSGTEREQSWGGARAMVNLLCQSKHAGAHAHEHAPTFNVLPPDQCNPYSFSGGTFRLVFCVKVAWAVPHSQLQMCGPEHAIAHQFQNAPFRRTQAWCDESVHAHTHTLTLQQISCV